MSHGNKHVKLKQS